MTQKKIETYLNIRNIYIVLFIITVLLFSFYVQQEYALTKQLEKQSIPEGFKMEIIDNFFKYRWLSFLVGLLMIFLRILLVGVCLYTGGLFFDNFRKQRYSKCFNIALKSDIILIGYLLIYAILIIALGYENAINVYQKTSLLGFFNLEIIESWLIVPLGTFNVFEVLYWFFMATLLSVSVKKTYKESFNFVVVTYGAGLLLYMLVMIFVVLYMTQ